MPSVSRLGSNPPEGGVRSPPGTVPLSVSAPVGAVPASCVPGSRGASPVSGSAGGPPEGVPKAGLVSSETKTTESGLRSIFRPSFSRSEFAELGRHRRLRRTRAAVLAKASSVRASVPAGFRWTGAFITLTYREVGAWEPQHVRRFLQAASVYSRRRGVRLRYVWVAETQRRGAVHYHLVVWWSSRHGRGFRLPKPDDSGWWPHGSSNIRRLRSAGEAYLAKYVSKGDDGALPRGLRLFGMDRDPADSLSVHRACLPRWLAKASGAGRCDRVPFLGWVSRATGEIFPARLRLVRERAGPSVLWRFLPAIQRDSRCLDCLFFVQTGRLPGLLPVV